MSVYVRVSVKKYEGGKEDFPRIRLIYLYLVSQTMRDSRPHTSTQVKFDKRAVEVRLLTLSSNI